jgi:hypothetical protein
MQTGQTSASSSVKMTSLAVRAIAGRMLAQQPAALASATWPAVCKGNCHRRRTAPLSELGVGPGQDGPGRAWRYRRRGSSLSRAVTGCRLAALARFQTFGVAFAIMVGGCLQPVGQSGLEADAGGGGSTTGGSTTGETEEGVTDNSSPRLCRREADSSSRASASSTRDTQ